LRKAGHYAALCHAESDWLALELRFEMKLCVFLRAEVSVINRYCSLKADFNISGVNVGTCYERGADWLAVQ